jgi:hypothetical protein
VCFFAFGGSLLPTPKFPPAIGTQISTKILRGSEASRFLLNWNTTDRNARLAISHARLRAVTLGADQVVVLTKRRGIVPAGLLGWLQASARAFGDEYYYTDDGVMILTPVEDPDTNIAAFNVYYSSSDGSIGGSARVDTTEAAYGDPDTAIEITDGWVNCAVAPSDSSVLAAAWGSFTGQVFAQTMHKGGDCSDLGHMDDVSKENLKEGLKNALISAGAAAIPCIGAEMGWAVCVGGAAIGGAAVSLGWDLATMVWDCRCTWFGVECDGGDPPPI